MQENEILLKSLEKNKLMQTNKEIEEYMIALDRLDNSDKKVEYIKYLVAGIDNHTNEPEITAGAVSILEDVIADEEVSFESVCALLNASLDDYDNKYQFLDEVYFALLNYCVDDNILVDCFKALTKKRQEKLLEVLSELKHEDEHKYEPIIKEIIEEK